MADKEQGPADKKGDDKVTAPANAQDKTIKVETQVDVKGYPEFQAALDAERQKAKDLEAKFKAEQDARIKAETDKTAALEYKAEIEEEKRLAKVAAVKAKFGDAMPDEIVKDLPSDKLDFLASDKAPAPKKVEDKPADKPEARSKAPPNGGGTTEVAKPKKKPWWNADGMAYHDEDKVSERGKSHEAAKLKCKEHEKVIAKAIRERGESAVFTDADKE